MSLLALPSEMTDLVLHQSDMRALMTLARTCRTLREWVKEYARVHELFTTFVPPIAINTQPRFTCNHLVRNPPMHMRLRGVRRGGAEPLTQTEANISTLLYWAASCLEQLSLRDVTIRESMWHCLVQCNKLTSLHLDSVGGMTVWAIENMITHFPRLTHLGITGRTRCDNWDLCNDIFPAIKRCGTLTSLDLSGQDHLTNGTLITITKELRGLVELNVSPGDGWEPWAEPEHVTTTLVFIHLLQMPKLRVLRANRVHVVGPRGDDPPFHTDRELERYATLLAGNTLTTLEVQSGGWGGPVFDTAFVRLLILCMRELKVLDISGHTRVGTGVLGLLATSKIVQFKWMNASSSPGPRGELWVNRQLTALEYGSLRGKIAFHEGADTFDLTKFTVQACPNVTHVQVTTIVRGSKGLRHLHVACTPTAVNGVQNMGRLVEAVAARTQLRTLELSARYMTNLRMLCSLRRLTVLKLRDVAQGQLSEVAAVIVAVGQTLTTIHVHSGHFPTTELVRAVADHCPNVMVVTLDAVGGQPGWALPAVPLTMRDANDWMHPREFDEDQFQIVFGPNPARDNVYPAMAYLCDLSGRTWYIDSLLERQLPPASTLMAEHEVHRVFANCRRLRHLFMRGIAAVSDATLALVPPLLEHLTLIGPVSTITHAAIQKVVARGNLHGKTFIGPHPVRWVPRSPSSHLYLGNLVAPHRTEWE